QAVSVYPKHLPDVLFRQVCHGQFMKWAFNDDLMSANAVHLVVDTLTSFIKVAFNLKGRELIGHDADTPALVIGFAVAVPVRQDFLGGLVFMSLAERAIGCANGKRLDLGGIRPFGPVCSDNDPPAHNGILA